MAMPNDTGVLCNLVLHPVYNGLWVKVVGVDKRRIKVQFTDHDVETHNRMREVLGLLPFTLTTRAAKVHASNLALDKGVTMEKVRGLAARSMAATPSNAATLAKLMMREMKGANIHINNRVSGEMTPDAARSLAARAVAATPSNNG